jgi:hypothetical protein
LPPCNCRQLLSDIFEFELSRLYQSVNKTKGFLDAGGERSLGPVSQCTQSRDVKGESLGVRAIGKSRAVSSDDLNISTATLGERLNFGGRVIELIGAMRVVTLASGYGYAMLRSPDAPRNLCAGKNKGF